MTQLKTSTQWNAFKRLRMTQILYNEPQQARNFSTQNPATKEFASKTCFKVDPLQDIFSNLQARVCQFCNLKYKNIVDKEGMYLQVHLLPVHQIFFRCFWETNKPEIFLKKHVFSFAQKFPI